MSERNYSFETSAIEYQIATATRLNTHTNTITQGDRRVELENRLVMLLVYFIHHQGEVLQKDLLLKTIWQGKVVNDDSLSVAVSHLRKALGDNPRAPHFIKTIPGVGYQFIAKAQAVAPDTTPDITPNAASDVIPAPTAAASAAKHTGWWLAGVVLFVILTFFGYRLHVSVSATSASADNGHEAKGSSASMKAAKKLLAQPDAESWRLAIKQLQDLLRHTQSAEAYWGIADAKIKLLNDRLAIRENCLEVVGLLQKSLALDPQLAKAHTTLANAMFWCQRNYTGAEQQYLAAIQLDGNDDAAPMAYAQLLLAQQRFDESLAQVEQARRLNPLNYSVPTVVWIYQMQGRNDLAMQELERILTTEPDNRYYHISAQRIFNRMGDSQHTFAQWQWLMRDAGLSSPQLEQAQQAFTADGLVGLNRWLLQQKLTADLGDYTPPLSWARYAIATKQYDLALDYLEAAYSQRQSPLLWAAVDPDYEPVRQHPRFQKILLQLKQSENK